MSEENIIDPVETDVKTEEGTKPELNNVIPRSRLNEVIEERNVLREKIEMKQEKFKNLNTTDLLNVVEELSNKSNPPENAGTIDTKINSDSWKSMSTNEKRKNWSSILDSYKR